MDEVAAFDPADREGEVRRAPVAPADGGGLDQVGAGREVTLDSGVEALPVVVVVGARDCEVIDLGTLGSFPDSVLEAEGRWTTEDCDSRFRSSSDAHTYRFHVAEAGRVRISLTSPEADSYLYLLVEDGSRIAGTPAAPR